MNDNDCKVCENLVPSKALKCDPLHLYHGQNGLKAGWVPLDRNSYCLYEQHMMYFGCIAAACSWICGRHGGLLPSLIRRVLRNMNGKY